MGAPLPLAPIHPKPYNPLLALLWIETVTPGQATACPVRKGCEGQDFAAVALGAASREGRATRNLSGPSTAGFQEEQGGKSCLRSSPPFMAGDLVTARE